MASKSYAQLLADSHVERSYIRPYGSHDNAFSESQFKTKKCPANHPLPNERAVLPMPVDLAQVQRSTSARPTPCPAVRCR